MTDDGYDWRDYDRDDEPVGSCESCGCNIYADDDDGSGLCDECQWWALENGSE